jgi:predicted ester cyclase
VSVEDHKSVVRRFYGEVATEGNLSLLDEIAREDMTDHFGLAMGLGSGRQGFRSHVVALRRNVPDLHTDVNELIGEDDIVVAYWTASGIAAGPMLGIEPTGQPFTLQGISRFRFLDGRIVEYQTMLGPLS